jgi:two-component system KDP operon response regulator KdpE
VSTGGRVLVVDDEPQFLRALATNLRGAGYAVETVATAAEALAAAALDPPDAVILDLVLPDGTGTDVCRELRTWSEAPIIVISAVGDEEEKIAALDAGADDYVTKPFAIGELLARLRAALRRSSAAGEPVIEFGDVRVDLEKQAVEVSGPAYGEESNYLHVYVSQLRRKIEPDPSAPRHLLTEPGAGYRLVVAR